MRLRRRRQVGCELMSGLTEFLRRRCRQLHHLTTAAREDDVSVIAVWLSYVDRQLAAGRRQLELPGFLAGPPTQRRTQLVGGLGRLTLDVHEAFQAGLSSHIVGINTR